MFITKINNNYYMASDKHNILSYWKEYQTSSSGVRLCFQEKFMNEGFDMGCCSEVHQSKVSWEKDLGKISFIQRLAKF